MMQRTANENAACLRRICKRSDQPKIERVQTESQIATVDSCFDLVGSLQHGVASCEVFAAGRLIFTNPLYMQLVMTSDETQIQIFANWPMSHAKRVTRDTRKNPEYRVVAAIRQLRTDTNCPAGKSWPNHVKNEQHIGSEKTYGPKNTEQQNMMQRTAYPGTAFAHPLIPPFSV